MMASMAGFTLNDTAIKSIGVDIPLFQVIALRGMATSVVIVLIAIYLKALIFRLPEGQWRLVAVRTGSEMAATYFFLTALMQMPLANVTAILQVLPLTVTLAGAVWFREAVGWRRMLSILIGFVGVLLIVRPGPEGFNTFALYAVVAVFFITLRDLSTRRMSDEVPSLLVTVCASVGVMAFGLVGTIGQEWVAVTQLGAMKLGAATLFLVIGSLTSVMMMRVGDVSFVAPFRYTGIVFALVIGFVVFGDWPDLVTLIGAGIVVASGVFTLLREGHLKRQEKRARM